MTTKRNTQNSTIGRTASTTPLGDALDPQRQQDDNTTVSGDQTIEDPLAAVPNNPGDSRSADATLPTRQKDDLENAPLAEIEVALEKARQDEIRLRKLQELRELERRTATRRIQIEELSSRGTSASTTNAPIPMSQAVSPPRSHLSTAAETLNRSVDHERTAPSVSNIKTFQAINYKECEGFLNKLETHFELHERFFRSNERAQVATGASLLGNELLSRWRREGKTHPDRTWENFKEFCERETTDPKIQRRNAALAYAKAEQRENQSVSEFSNHLEALEDQMKVAYTNEQKKTHLYAKIHATVQQQAQQTSGEPNDYNEYISWLRACEDNVPGRVAMLGQAKRNRMTAASNRGKSAPAPRDFQVRTGNSYKRKRDNNGDNRPPICWKCKKGRHPANDCRSVLEKKNPIQQKN